MGGKVDGDDKVQAAPDFFSLLDTPSRRVSF